MKRMRWIVLFSLGLLAGCDAGGTAEPDRPTPLELDVPASFPVLFMPVDNPLTEEGVALGRRLFFDPILSRDSTRACASCHAPAQAFSDQERFSLGVGGQRGTRQSMPLMNVAWMPSFFWDGRAVSLEEQVGHPVTNPVEMGEEWGHVLAKLERHRDYPALFMRAFETPEITQARVAKAIAQFERTLISGGSKFDRFLAGEAALTAQEQLGYDLFNTERADCFHCHGNILFTDNDFHNNGLDTDPEDPGLSAVTGRPSDFGKFKTPTLRNLAYTAPYMHDGRFTTLEEVVDHYATGLQRSSTLDPLLLRAPLRLTPEEKEALIAFLLTLSDPAFLDDPGAAGSFGS